MLKILLRLNHLFFPNTKIYLLHKYIASSQETKKKPWNLITDILPYRKEFFKTHLESLCFCFVFYLKEKNLPRVHRYIDDLKWHVINENIFSLYLYYTHECLPPVQKKMRSLYIIESLFIKVLFVYVYEWGRHSGWDTREKQQKDVNSAMNLPSCKKRNMIWLYHILFMVANI